MGEMGKRRIVERNVEIGVKENMGINEDMGTVEDMGIGEDIGDSLTPLKPFHLFDIETLKFYPLDENLPPIVQLKLRCKELNYLLHQIQNSLLAKMYQEKTLPAKDKLRLQENEKKDADDFEKSMFEQYGFKKLENGQVIEREV